MDVVYTIFPNLFIKVCVNDRHNYWKSEAMTYECQTVAAFQTPHTRSVFDEIWLFCRYRN
jgi:hypothetical protein